MALTKTNLTAALGADDLKLRVASTAGATVNCLVQIGDEFMVCMSIDSATQLGVRSRGSQGTSAKAHNNLAQVTLGLGADFPTSPGGTYPRSDWDVREATVNDDFDPGITGGKNLTRNTEVLIMKAGSWTQTISNPSQAQDGLQVRFIVAATGGSAVITFLAGLYGTTTASDVATLPGPGASVTIRAQNGLWGFIGGVIPA